ncbi:hypothetical protein RRG08_016923 [Elysia crispata]|uniref:Ion transport domain-containing protein n=1 Tax=Elysia crispata TaxID=231223 RepID=A0AAE0ZTC0_9GAST|nr:hypothetical protein RRG08_016923 [Elysia crispata]
MLITILFKSLGVAEYFVNKSIEYAVDTENLSISAIRTIRVLRPLRAINRIPSMRILVMLLLDTLPMLGNVLLLCFFVFFIFGIIGVQLWSGVLRHRCFLDLNESYTLPDYVPVYYTPSRGKTEYICSSENNSGIRTCDASSFPLYEYEGIKCNGSARMDSDNDPTNDSCVNWNQYYTRCEAKAENPFKGAVSFDNIGLAWVAIFQVISLESWVNIMYYVQDAHSFWDFTYFVALIVIGSFFMINLCLVVIATQFSETKKRETERMMQERKRFQSCSTLASNSEPGGCYTELLKLVAQVYRRVKRKVIKMYYKTRGLQKINPEKSLSLRRKKAKRKGSRPRSSSAFAAAGCGGPPGQTSSLKSPQQQQQQQQPQQHNSSSSASASSRQQSFSYPAPTTVHHHQHQHLVPSPSPQPQQHQHVQSANPNTQQLHTDNTKASARRSSLPRPPSSIIVQAPTASPEQSDIDSMSSPRCPNFLALPSSPYSPLHPSSDSLAALSHLSVDAAFVPALLLKSPHPPNSPNQLGFPSGPAMSLSRASSYNSGVSGGGARGPMPSLPEVLAAQGAKNAALAASNMLLNLDYEPSKAQSLADKGLFADNLLMDMVGDGSKQINAQLPLQGGPDAEGASTAAHNHQVQQQHPDNQDSGSCSGGGGTGGRCGSGGGTSSGNGGGGGCGSGSRDGKEFAGELQALPSCTAAVTGSTMSSGSCTAVVPAGSGLYSGHSAGHPGGHTGPSAVVIASGACEDYDSDVELSRDESSAQSRSSNICELLSRWQKRLRRLVESTFFQRSILLAILLNTLSMAVEHHNQPELLTMILEYSNIVFCVLFGAEMAFKIVSYGVFGYISNGFNVFDSFIVILSIVELAQGGASGLSVLRTFRLLRILKLVRFMPALRRQLVVMLRTMDNVATFFALLVLFMFIFSILGMSLFGCKFCHKLEDGKQKCDRKNFDSLLWAIITVFQVPSLPSPFPPTFSSGFHSACGGIPPPPLYLPVLVAWFPLLWCT